jgi:predicted nucleic acid-binding protein
MSDCTVLYSEDLHDGLIIDGLAIRNPFVAR